MGLACSQIRLLRLTQRKADCEYGIAIDSMEKMALTREQSELSKRYYSMLQGKQVSYYANGEYNKINYNYLMGFGSKYERILDSDYEKQIKKDNSMVLTDSYGRVVLSYTYAKAITDVLGSSAMDASGKGGTFSRDKIAEILAKLFPSVADAETFQAAIDDEELSAEFNSHNDNTITKDTVSEGGTTDSSKQYTESVKKLTDFYYPIFLAASANGWTTEYNRDINTQENYISDSLITGTLQLAEVHDDGGYDPNTSLNYFLMTGAIEAKSTAAMREEITAWYNAEKDRVCEKENRLELHMKDLSTELESINTEMESIKGLTKDAMSIFEWGG